MFSRFKKKKPKKRDFVTFTTFVTTDVFKSIKAGKHCTCALPTGSNAILRDYLQFVEVDAAGVPTGNELQRRILSIVRAGFAGCTHDVATFEKPAYAWRVFIALGCLVFLFGVIVLHNEIEDVYDVRYFGLKAPFDKLCTVQVKNSEPHEWVENVKSPGQKWRVAIYNGECPWRPGRADGKDFLKEVSSNDAITHRFNASDPTEAAAALRDICAKAKKSGAIVDTVFVFDHATTGTQVVGKELLNDAFFNACQECFSGRKAFGLVLLGCRVAHGAAGREFIRLVSKCYAYDVYASDFFVSYDEGSQFRGFGNVWRADPNGEKPQRVPRFGAHLWSHITKTE